MSTNVSKISRDEFLKILSNDENIMEELLIKYNNLPNEINLGKDKYILTINKINNDDELDKYYVSYYCTKKYKYLSKYYETSNLKEILQNLFKTVENN